MTARPLQCAAAYVSPQWNPPLMPALANMRQEAFCLALIGGNGSRPSTQTAAYLAAGYVAADSKTAGDNASRLIATDRVKARMDELKAEQGSAASLSRAQLLEQMQRVTLAAEADGSHSAAIRGTELLGKELAGMFKDRSEVAVSTVAGMTEAEVRGELAAVFRAMGLPTAAESILRGDHVPALVPTDPD